MQDKSWIGKLQVIPIVLFSLVFIVACTAQEQPQPESASEVHRRAEEVNFFGFTIQPEEPDRFEDWMEHGRAFGTIKRSPEIFQSFILPTDYQAVESVTVTDGVLTATVLHGVGKGDFVMDKINIMGVPAEDNSYRIKASLEKMIHFSYDYFGQELDNLKKIVEDVVSERNGASGYTSYLEDGSEFHYRFYWFGNVINMAFWKTDPESVKNYWEYKANPVSLEEIHLQEKEDENLPTVYKVEAKLEIQEDMFGNPKYLLTQGEVTCPVAYNNVVGDSENATVFYVICTKNKYLSVLHWDNSIDLQ